MCASAQHQGNENNLLLMNGKLTHVIHGEVYSMFVSRLQGFVLS
jgi:hypothetical protein